MTYKSNIKKKIAFHFKAFMEASDLTGLDLAVTAGVDKRDISHILMCDGAISIKKYEKVFNALGLTIKVIPIEDDTCDPGIPTSEVCPSPSPTVPAGDGGSS